MVFQIPTAPSRHNLHRHPKVNELFYYIPLRPLDEEGSNVMRGGHLVMRQPTIATGLRSRDLPQLPNEEPSIVHHPNDLDQCRKGAFDALASRLHPDLLGVREIDCPLAMRTSMDLTRNYTAPIARLGCLAFEGQGAFAS
jgi:hypothetical protein